MRERERERDIEDTESQRQRDKDSETEIYKETEIYRETETVCILGCIEQSKPKLIKTKHKTIAFASNDNLL